MIKFPEGFVWGAATSSYQIEGSDPADGRGECVWDAFHHNGGVACGHLYQADEDVNLMRSIGLQAYRFSISWPRVIPNGTGSANRKGIEFYDRLIDDLLEAGIDPWVTLFHWDYPRALFLKGGWLNPDSPAWFADYAARMAIHYGDRVKNWITHNEPQVFLQLGHVEGTHAPGMKYSWRDALLCAHNVLLSHGMAVMELRNLCGEPSVGMAHAMGADYPHDANSVEAARNSNFSVSRKDFWNGSWFSDPIFFGRYPEDGAELYGNDMPKIGQGDMKIISQPVDFQGLNIYRGNAIDRGGEVPYRTGGPITTFQWNITPESLYWGPRFMEERYGCPIVITENGMANPDWKHLDGGVHDPQRIDFMARHLEELRLSIRDGIDIRGYFHWSLMDNFEWAEAYRQRFGLIYVDYLTQERTLKDSAYWYKKVIEENAV